ncbi:MAG: hypothetical protein M3Y09_19465 [Actinomycetota bacterium]|nr:hypothetical protein [Actinomycetota bacterium]
MSDDPSRPAPGPQSDPYPVANAPEWWSALGRRDLPLDGPMVPKTVPPELVPAAHTPPRPGRAGRPGVRWRAVGFNAALLLVALLIVCFGVGVISLPMFLAVTLIFGVPMVLTAVTIAVIAHRSR